MKSNKVLVTLANENYLEQAKQLFSSAYFNAGWNGDFLLLAHEVPDEKLQWFKDKGILIKKCQAIPCERLNGKWPDVVLSKFYIFTPEFKQWDNVIFLDADIIVRASLEKLENLKGLNAVTGHRRFSSLWLNRIHLFLEKIQPLLLLELKQQLDFSSKSFNTGVLAFSTDIIRDDTFDLLIKLSNKFFALSASGEEAILNVYFYKQWQELSAFYNTYPDCLIPEAGLKPEAVEGAILHFIINKPWLKKSPFYNEWSKSLTKAEKINIEKPETRHFTSEEIKNILSDIEIRQSKRLHIKFFDKIYQETDRLIGLAGLSIKRVSPRTYHLFKKIKR
jgi:lipopolysaccharide biosynthesis glycosyltransferase